MRANKAKDTVDLDFTLRRVFGISAFRPLQREVVCAALEGHDVFVQAATSFGKSLCYQLPAVVGRGITVVVSPLLALMTDQIDAARARGIPTETISSSTTLEERRRVETDLKCGHPYTRLLYVTPEQCALTRFRKLLTMIHTQGQLTRVAIDEAHCISEWGHDFRPAYKELRWLKQCLILPSVPIIALTATATLRVKDDILTCLGLDDKTKVFTTTTARPNLHYEVRYFSESSRHHSSGDDMLPNLVTWLTSISERRTKYITHLESTISTVPPSALLPITGIIYVPFRNSTETLSSRLTSQSISASAYHAGLSPPARTDIQNKFLHPVTPTAAQARTLAGSFNIIVATTAFGMGIDCPVVRFVVHYNLPRGLEAFVQESGRAGRDGKAASCVLMYTREDRDRVNYRVGMDVQRELKKAGGAARNAQQPVSSTQASAQSKMHSLERMIAFCETTARCRHELIAEYFAGESGVEEKPKCDYACDHCKEGPEKLKKRMAKGLANEEAAFEFSQRQREDHGWEGYEDI